MYAVIKFERENAMTCPARIATIQKLPSVLLSQYKKPVINCAIIHGFIHIVFKIITDPL